MKKYLATATSDWGYIYTDERIEASGWSTAFNRAGRIAQKQCRKRPKRVSITLSLVGTVKKFDDAAHLGLPADETTPEEVL